MSDQNLAVMDNTHREQILRTALKKLNKDYDKQGEVIKQLKEDVIKVTVVAKVVKRRNADLRDDIRKLKRNRTRLVKMFAETILFNEDKSD